MAHEGSIAMMALNRAQWFDYHAVSLAIAQENLGKEEQEEELAGSILPAVGKTDLHIIYLAYTLGRCLLTASRPYGCCYTIDSASTQA